MKPSMAYNIDAYRPKRDGNGELTVAPPLELTPDQLAADAKRFAYGRIFGWWWKKRALPKRAA
jgi:hypothetical protein